MSAIDKSVERVLEAYSAAVFAKDTQALVSLYAPQVHIFDAWEDWSYEGLPEWQAVIENWFGSLAEERVRVTFSQVRDWTDRDAAAVCAIVTYAAVSPAGKQLRAMQNRLTLALRRSDSDFTIVHQHTSAPIRFDDMKAILRHPTAP